MTCEEIQSAVLGEMYTVLGIPVDDIDESFEDLGVDSLDLVELGIFLDVRFDIKMDHEEVQALKTPRGIIDLIDFKLNYGELS